MTLYLFDRVVVDVDDAVEIANDDPSDLLEFFEIERLLFAVDEARESDGGEIANRNFVGAAVLDDLRAQVAALYRAEVLLVAFAVASVFVQHVRCTRLNLRLNDCVPQTLRLDCLATSTFRLVPEKNINMTHFQGHQSRSFDLVLFLLGVELLKFFAPNILQARALARTHERPVGVRFDSLHEKIRNPESVEEVACALLVLARVLAQVEKVEHVCVPRLQVDGEGARTLQQDKCLILPI